jgi:hypothetical protein
MASPPSGKSKGLWLAIVSVLAWIAPFCVNLWVYGFIFAIPIHAIILLIALVSLCMKGGISRPFPWIALILSICYFIAIVYAFNNFNYGPGP